MAPEDPIRAFHIWRGAHKARAGETAMEHRLVACLHADVSGYSRLIADDVEETARMLTAYQDLIGRIVATHGGWVINVAGDSLLAASSTLPAAVRCAVEVQRQLRVRNAGLPPHRRMQFRVGIDFGDVLVEDGRLFGDCVNVATRVQEVAAPGTICLAGSAFDRIDGSLPLRTEYLGERVVKNIEKPLRIYQVGGAADRGASPRSHLGSESVRAGRARRELQKSPAFGTGTYTVPPQAHDLRRKADSGMPTTASERGDLASVTQRGRTSSSGCQPRFARSAATRSRGLLELGVALATLSGCTTSRVVNEPGT
jgi:class 3 adenylate cyclase